MTVRAAALGFCIALWAGTVFAQDSTDPVQVPRSPVLVIEFDRLISGSRAGQAILAELETAREALVAENEQIQNDLTEEERALTEQRATLPAEEFRALADAFDAKVTALRSAQDEKARALTQEAERRQQEFLQTVRPILAQIMVDARADVMIEADSVVMRQEGVVITNLAIQRIDATFSGPATDQAADPADTQDN